MAAQPKFDQGAFKDGQRDSRLSISGRAERKMKDELKDIALKKCDNFVKGFVECAKEQNLMVVFNCRKQLRAMNECCKSHTTDAKFEEYKAMRVAELEKLP